MPSLAGSHRAAPLSIFHPAQIPDAVIGYQGDIELFLVSSNVERWTNKAPAGTAYDAIQGTAGNQPPLGTTRQNGILGVTFSAAGKYLNPDTTGLLNGKTGVSIFAVIQSGTGAQQNIIGISQGNVGSDSWRAGLAITSGNAIEFGGSRTDSVPFPAGVTGGTHTTSPEIIHATWHLATQTVKVYLNGAEVASSTSYSTAGDTFDATDPDTAEVGDYIFYHSDQLTGDLFDLWVYDRAVSRVEEALIKNYLSKRYAIKVS